MLAEIKIFFESNNLRNQLIRGSLVSLSIRVGGALLSFIMTTILTRTLKASGYGIYSNAMAWVGVFSVIATFGFSTLHIRDVPFLSTKQKWNELKGFLRFSNIFIFIFSSLIIIGLWALGWHIYQDSDNPMALHTFWVSLTLVPLYAFSRLRQGAIRGFEHVARALLPEMVFRPGLVFVGMLILNFSYPEFINSLSAMLLTVFIAFINFMIGTYWLRKLQPFQLQSSSPEYRPLYWIKSAFPMLVYSGMQIILSQTSVLVLGIQSSTEDVGLFSAASRLAALVIFFIAAVQVVIAPFFSRLSINNEKEKLQKVLTATAHVTIGISTPLALFFVFAGKFVLGIFGPSFMQAQILLIILVAGNMYDITMGSSALLLSMTGHEQIVAKVFTSSTLINIPLNIIMIYFFGVSGAAWATLINLVFSRSILAYISYKKLNLNPTVFNKLIF